MELAAGVAQVLALIQVRDVESPDSESLLSRRQLRTQHKSSGCPVGSLLVPETGGWHNDYQAKKALATRGSIHSLPFLVC